ncbi:hypothetical protein R5R35_001777 [Gryllus longicercus]
MVSPLVLLFLLLPIYVEDSSASTLSLTRVRRYASPVSSKETGGTEESNPINSFAVSSTTFPKDDENTTHIYSETNVPDSENCTDISDASDRSSPWNLETQVSSEAPVNNSHDSNFTTTESSEPVEGTEVSSEPPEPLVNSNDSNLTTTESSEPTEETEVPSSIATTESGVIDSSDGSESTIDSIDFFTDSTSYLTKVFTSDTSVSAETPSDMTPDTLVPTTTTTTTEISTLVMPTSTDSPTARDMPTTTDMPTTDTPTTDSPTTDTPTTDSPTTDTPTTDTPTTDSPTTDTPTTDMPTTDTPTTDSPTTDTPTTDMPTTDTPTTTDIATGKPDEEEGRLKSGTIAAIIVTILLIGIGIVLLTAHRYGKLRWPPQNLFSNGLTDPIRPQPVTLKKFPAHCSDMLNITSKLSHEYQLLATLSLDIYATESFVAGQLPDNKSKNRYVNILPYDSTRVKLASDGDDFYSDYINASYIKGYTNEIEYIATQGPKEDTCRDFWKMVYQEPIKVIIMVTQLEEQGKPKCYKYFPNLRENLEFEDIIVRCTTELHFPIYTSRTLILTKGERKRSIIHLHFREWPDFGCPATPDLMLQFCQVMRHNIVLAQPGITLIHCSAGVGRTGTLIAVDILLQHIKENKKIDIFGTVYKLRKHRMNMVQSEAQYVYIYKCIKEALEDPSYLSSENSSTTSLEPIYENIECTRLSTVSSKIIPDTVVNESECAL